MTEATLTLEDTWKVESIFSDLAQWEKAFDEIPRGWPEVTRYQGKLGDGAETVREALDALFAADRNLDKLYTWAHLRHDEETTHDSHTTAYKKALSLAQDFQRDTSWVQPELLALPDSQLDEYLASDALADYRIYLDKLMRLKPHTLTPEKEELVAMAAKALSSQSRAFRAMNDSDMEFGSVRDSKGDEHLLTHGSYMLCLQNPDAELRKNAFTQYHERFAGMENTFCELLTGQVQVHQFNAQARNYGSSLEAALGPKNIDPSVYRSLITGIRKGLPTLHKYCQVRKERLGLDELHLYDMYLPLMAEFDRNVPYEEAEKLVVDSVAPLGNDYQEILRKGLARERWVDRYERKNKRSGAYSSGCFDTQPYILMNYKGILRHVFTLAHEAGHSMHSYHSWNEQKIQDAYYPIFVAEVASTFNEELLHRLLMERATSDEERRYLIGSRVEDLRATLFRQTMFAEFELKIHELVESDVPLTPALLKEEYLQLNRDYFGPAVTIDQEIEIEWARIPHFYYNFYVYQYATGVSAALALVEKVMQGGDRERQDYLNFLSGGSSKYPIDLLKLAGVDMTSPEPVQRAVNCFGKLVDQL